MTNSKANSPTTQTPRQEQCKSRRYISSIKLAQTRARKVWRITITAITLVIGLRRQDTRSKALFVTPERRRFRIPSPVPPAPAVLETRHLGLGEHKQERLVFVRVRADICVGHGAATTRVRCRTPRRQSLS